MHLNEGLLQAYLDGEVSETEKKLIEKHLSQCGQCQILFTELKELNNLTNATIGQYEKQFTDISIDLQKAYEMFTKKRKNYQWKGMISKMFKHRKLVAGLAAGVIFATTLFVPPVRQAAADFLHIFRVQKIESIQIDMDDLTKMRNEFMSKVGEIDLKQLGKANIVSQPKFETMTLKEAKEKVSFPLKYPAQSNLGQEVQVNHESKIELTLNTDQVNKVLKQLGSKKLLPKELDGKTFSIYSRGQVGLHLNLDDGNSGKDVTLIMDGKEIPRNKVNLVTTNNRIILQQIASPEITVPDGVNVAELRDVLLNIPILPYDLKNKLQAVQDWQHTLLVPTAKNSEIVNINGEKGILEKQKNYSQLIWQSDGVIYNLSINGSNQLDIVEIARNLRDL